MLFHSKSAAPTTPTTPTTIPCPTIDVRLFVPVNYRHITTVCSQAPARPSCIQFASHCVDSARFTSERQPTAGYVILSSRETQYSIVFRWALDGPLGTGGKQARAASCPKATTQSRDITGLRSAPHQSHRSSVRQLQPQTRLTAHKSSTHLTENII